MKIIHKNMWNESTLTSSMTKSRNFTKIIKKSLLFTNQIYLTYTFNERADSQHWYNRLFFK
jgi:hypothetical protein